MRIGLAGVGRIGAFHAETLRGLDAVDQLVVTDADPARAAAGRRPSRDWSSPPDTEALLDVGHRRPRHRHRDARPRPAAAPGVAAGIADLLREAGRLHPRRDDRAGPTWSTAPTCPCTSASSGASTPGYRRARGRGGVRASSASSTPSGPTPTTAPRRTRPTSPPAAASSATATCTTSTSSGSSPGARSSPSTRPAPTRARASSPRPATSTPAPPSSPSTTARSARSPRPATTAAGHDVRMEVLGERRARSPSVWTTRWRCAPLEDGVDFPHGPAEAGRSWSASCPPTGPS